MQPISDKGRAAVAPTLGLRLDRGSDEPLFRQIAAQLRSAIASGRLAPGTRLPAERLLSRALGVNRTTVLGAYGERLNFSNMPPERIREGVRRFALALREMLAERAAAAPSPVAVEATA